jgi:hypothetical protein
MLGLLLRIWIVLHWPQGVAVGSRMTAIVTATRAGNHGRASIESSAFAASLCIVGVTWL